jgi:AcrR family transcriptional regulator
VRLYGAIVEIIADDGFEKVTVRGVSRFAGVSTGTFYVHFANTEACLASAIDWIGDGALRRVDQGRWSRRGGEDGVTSLLYSLLSDFAQQPKATQVLLIGVSDGGPQARSRAEAFTGGLELLIADRLIEVRLPGPRLLSGAMAAAVTHVARQTTLTNRAEELPGLTDSLAAWLYSRAA